MDTELDQELEDEDDEDEDNFEVMDNNDGDYEYRGAVDHRQPSIRQVNASNVNAWMANSSGGIQRLPQFDGAADDDSDSGEGQVKSAIPVITLPTSATCVNKVYTFWLA